MSWQLQLPLRKQNMSTQSGVTATSKEHVDAAHASIDSAENGDTDMMKKHGTNVPVEEETHFFYLEGWKLWAIMCTLYLNTLLAALDVVSINLFPSIRQH